MNDDNISHRTEDRYGGPVGQMISEDEEDSGV